jgi:hypothetical protein
MNRAEDKILENYDHLADGNDAAEHTKVALRSGLLSFLKKVEAKEKSNIKALQAEAAKKTKEQTDGFSG